MKTPKDKNKWGISNALLEANALWMSEAEYRIYKTKKEKTK